MLRNVLFPLIVSLIPLCGNEIVEWDFALNSSPGGSEAVLTAVESAPLGFGSNVSAAFAGGHFNGTLNLPGLTNSLFAQTSLEGIVVRFSPNTGAGWSVQWATQTFSERDVLIHDLAITEDTGLIYVAGSYQGEVFFGPNQAVMLPKPPATEGFVAVLNQATGAWQSAFALGDQIPRSIALDGNDEFYITSSKKLIAKYDQTGGLLWDLDAVAGTIAAHHIATLPVDSGKAESFVMTSVFGSAATGTDIQISAISENGVLLWEKIAASQSDDQAGGLGVSPQGLVSFSLSTNDDQVLYNGDQIEPTPSPVGVEETYLVRIRPDSSRIWSTRVAAGDTTNSMMSSTDLAHDPLGNVHLAINFNGTFTFEGRQRFGNGDTGILSVGDGGIPYNMLESTGASEVSARGIAAPLREEQIIVGKHQGGNTLTFGTDTLFAGNEPRLFAAFSKKLPSQTCYIIRQQDGDTTPPNLFLENLRAVLERGPNATPQLSSTAEIYREFNFPGLLPGPAGFNIGVVGYAAFISDQDIDNLESSGLFAVEEDLIISPSGTTSPSSYNLAKLNDSTASGPHSYTFPEMCQPVRLYLIDTAVYDPGGSYFASNSALTILDPITGGYGELIRAPMETAGIVTSEHGTNLLSLVAGPDQGVAQSTPLTTKVYDIFPTLGSARASALIEALLRARLDRTDPANVYEPAIILIASNSVTTVLAGDLPALEIAIDACCAAEIPIVMSAGNDSAAAASYAPAKFGDRACVLCTGATTAAGGFAGLSNFGPEVQIVAPGVNTIVATEVSGTQTTKTFTGTSASAALAAGALVHFQSANPWLLGSDLVSEFLTNSTHATDVSSGGNTYQQVKSSSTRPGCFSDYTDWTTWFTLANTGFTDNDDGDLYTNLEEYVHGLDPNSPEGHPYLFGIDSYSHPTLTMSFPVAWWLWDSTAIADVDENYLLRDGDTMLRAASSITLDPFTGESVSLTSGTECGVQTLLSFEKDVTDATKKFFRIEISEP